MMQISSMFSGGPRLSPRTADYVATLIREGDNFDYSKWLERVRGQKADVGKSWAEVSSSDVTGSTGAGKSITTFGCEDAHLSADWEATIRSLPRAKKIFRSLRQHAGNQEIRIWRRLDKVGCAWDTFQETRARDAVYGYLEAVFAIVSHYKTRRKTNKLLRHAFHHSLHLRRR
jgi:hypothetical protein